MKTIAMVAVLGLAASVQAQVVSHTFDISGLVSEGSFGDNFPTLTHNFGAPGTVIGVSFSVFAAMNSPSWSEELQIAIDTIDDTSFDGDIDMSLWGGVANSNPFAGAGALPASSISSDGDVFLTLYESFNDSAPNPDAIYGPGSSVTVEYRLVPAPGAMAILGLGGVVALRRRR